VIASSNGEKTKAFV